MRPPRIVSLVIFITAALFLLVRSFTYLGPAPSPNNHLRKPAVHNGNHPASVSGSTSGPAHRPPHSNRPLKSAVVSTPAVSSPLSTNPRHGWTFSSFARHFSLFPPLAVVSLMDDNSTAFPARPAAFGPLLQDAGMDGQLWVGSSFSDDNLPEGDGDGELGCSDIPNWGFNMGLSTASMAPANARIPVVPRPKHPRALTSADAPPDFSAWSAWSSSSSSSSSSSKPVLDDGTDDYLHQDAVTASKQSFGSSFSSASSNNDPTGSGGFRHADIKSMQETAEIAGKIVLLSRGGCGFLEKVKWAQRRGAIALIIGDNRKGGPLIQMYARGDTSNVTIPSIFVARTTGQLLAALSQPGSFIEDSIDENGKSAIKVQRSEKAVGKTPKMGKTMQTAKAVYTAKQDAAEEATEDDATPGWFTRVFHWHTSEARPAEDAPFDMSDNPGGAKHSKSTAEIDDFIIGVQDWRDPDLMPKKSAPKKTSKQTSKETSKKPPSHKAAAIPDTPAREGLWITISPSSETGSTLDLLVVVFISPVFTLAIVYMFVSIRDRIRDRRWRVPKSVVQRLPVRTYHRVVYSPSPIPSPAPSSPRLASSPDVSSPTTPLLAPAGEPTLAESAAAAGSASGGYFGVQEALVQAKMAREARGKKKDKAKKSSQWQKYMGRQSECVVCLEEYEDGVSQVMSLPCGHEFHAHCITPWLTARRRTCPICKGDVLQSLEEGASAGSFGSSYGSASSSSDEPEPEPEPESDHEPERQRTASDELEASAFRLARSIASSLRSGVRSRPNDVEAQNDEPSGGRRLDRADGV